MAMPEKFRKIIVLFMLIAALSVPAAYAVVNGRSLYALIGAVGLLVLSFIIRSEYRLPIVLLYLCVLCADSHILILHQVGIKLRWAVLAFLVFKEMAFWGFAKKVQVRITAAHIILVAFIILAFSSTLYSVRPDISFERTVSIALFFVVIFLYFWRQTTSHASRIDLIVFIAKGIPVVYLLELVYSLAASNSAWASGRLRALSGNPNGLGQLIMITMPVLYWYYLLSRRSPRRIYLGIGILMGIVLLLLSGSRASILGLGVCLLIITFRMAPRYFMAMLLAVTTIGVISSVYGLSFFHGTTPLDEKSVAMERLKTPDLGGREEAWVKAYEIGKEKPLLGYGFGTAMYTFGQQKFKRHYGGYPHNFILHTFLDVGLVGVFLVVALHVVLFKHCYRCIGSDAVRIDAGLPLLVAGLFLAGVINAFFENWMFSAGSPTAFPYWFMTMLMLRCSIQVKDARRTPSNSH